LRLLLDQNVPASLAKLLPGHDVVRASRMGWSEISNGLLIRAAQDAGFDAIVTADKNIRYQQNLSVRNIGIVVIPTQNIDVLREGLAALESALAEAVYGAYVEFDLPRRPRLRRPPPKRL